MTCGGACSRSATATSAATCQRSRRPTKASQRRTTWRRCWLCICGTRGSARRNRSSSPAGRGSAPRPRYFWDHTEWSRLYALLEPTGLRSWLLRALSSPYDRSFGFDTMNGGPLGQPRTPPTTTRCSGSSSTTSALPATVAFLDEQAGSADRARAPRAARLRLEGPGDRGDRRRSGRLRRRPLDPAGMRAQLRQRGCLLQRRLRRNDPLFAGLLDTSDGRRGSGRPTPRRTRWPGPSSGWRCHAGAGRSGIPALPSRSGTAWTSAWSPRTCTPT